AAHKSVKTALISIIAWAFLTAPRYSKQRPQQSVLLLAYGLPSSPILDVLNPHLPIDTKPSRTMPKQFAGVRLVCPHHFSGIMDRMELPEP
ncbi:MAG: hypothetical protein SGI77_12905, partial [Pirellulaceae bacterium]|nr:hypothetical protein [Pirellulaceae bacterium]